MNVLTDEDGVVLIFHDAQELVDHVGRLNLLLKQINDSLEPGTPAEQQIQPPFCYGIWSDHVAKSIWAPKLNQITAMLRSLQGGVLPPSGQGGG